MRQHSTSQIRKTIQTCGRIRLGRGRMGLDPVELVMRTEDEFGISIADDEAAAARTVGDLYQLVLSKLDLTPSCLSSKAFYRTRQALVISLDVPRRLIRPSSDLEQLFPEPTRKNLWQNTVGSIELKFPELQYPSRWRERFWKVGAALSAIIVVTFSVVIQHRFGGVLSVFAIWIPAIAVWMIVFAAIDTLFQRYATTLKTELPCRTAGDLSRLILTANYEHFSPVAAQNSAFSKEDVWKKLVDIICDQLQVRPEEVVPNASFVEDLGID